MLEIVASVIDPAKNVVLCRPRGSIDATTAPYLKNVITGFITEGRHNLVMDFNLVDYISSAGWGVILGRLREFRDIGGDIYLVDMRPAVISVFKLMGLNTVLRYFESVADLGADLGFKVAETPIAVPSEPAVAVPYPKEQSFPAKLEAIVKEHPLWGARQIAQELARSAGGGRRVGSFKIFRELVRLGLGTERKRLFFAFKELKRARNEANPRP